MSKFLARIWGTIRVGKKRRLVGQDLEGNRFFESVLDEVEPQKPRRTVEYKKTGDLWDSASGISRLPAQWTAWLAHTRTQPPTIDELERDLARQERVAFLVARIKKKDEEARENGQPRDVRPPLQSRASSPDVSLSPEAPQSKPIGPTPEPQRWVPHSTRKGSDNNRHGE